jgi:pyridoxamine 5'-phosphate oxidase
MRRADLNPDPLRQFRSWFFEAEASGAQEPNAMALATADADGRPSARMVLLRAVHRRGFVFYTNYESRKGRELDANPRAALVFYWEPLERQVRAGGVIERIAPEASDEYFASRPRGSRLATWASPQSRELPDRGALEAAFAEAGRRYPGDDIPRPKNWGGYLMVPDEIEFWVRRPNRLHDRFRYRRGDSDDWVIDRLAP